MEADQIYVRVKTGNDYNADKEVLVNKDEPTSITSEEIDALVRVNLQNYRGPKDSTSTSPYFNADGHSSDLFSIGVLVKFKQDIKGDALLWGNDFDEPIKDHLPYGFSVAYRIMKTVIDPGIDGDVYADKPYLFGPLLSSMTTIRKENELSWAHDPISEDLLPDTTGALRQKHFLDQKQRECFVFKKDEVYAFDFFSGYLDFNSFRLQLPGFALDMLPHMGDIRYLRFVMKTTTNLLLVVKFEIDEAKPESQD